MLNSEQIERLKQQIGANIRIQRKNAQCTQQELAEWLDKSRFWLTAIETGNNLPTIKSLYQLTEVLKCSISDFLPQKVNQEPISFIGPTDLSSTPATKEQILSMLDGIQNGKI